MIEQGTHVRVSNAPIEYRWANNLIGIVDWNNGAECMVTFYNDYVAYLPLTCLEEVTK